MSKNITFVDLTTSVPADYLNDLQETKTGIALGVKLSVSGGTTINLAGDPLTESQYSIRIGQKPRYGTSTVSVVGSGGAGGRDIFVTSGNVDTPKAAAMELQINPATPATAFFRKIGELTWSGAAVTNLRLTTGVQANADQVNNFIFTPFLNSSTPLTVRGLASQSADILRVEDSASTAILRVTATAVIFGAVTSTGVNTFPAGTQVAPSLTFTGDTSTGIFSPGSGRVAITTTNSNNFEVNAASGILVGSSVTTTPVTFGGDVSLSRGAANRLDLASGDSFNIVSGSLLFAGVQATTAILSDTATLIRTSGSSFAGPVGFTTGTQASPSHYFVADTSTGIFSPGSGRVAISTTNLNNFEVNAASGILIGSSTPATPITLGGDVILSRGAPNRLDLASGDSLNLITGAGSLLMNGTALASTHLSDSASLLRVSATDYFDARMFGVTGVATDDQTAALQAAIDAATAAAVGGLYNVPTLRLPPGQITLTSTIQWKACNMTGAWPNNGTRIVWNGVSGGTVFQVWSTTHAGNSSYRLLENVNFRSGTNEPNTFIDFTTGVSNGLIDEMCRLRNVHFLGCLSDAITVARWVNCHWEHLRFDLVGGYAIRLTPISSMNLSTFRLDGFTYDHSRSSSPGAGVFMIDNTADASNLGTFSVSNGRIEVNQAWAAAGTVGTGAASQRGVFVIRNSAAPAATRELGLEVRNVTYADASGMVDDVFLYRDTVNITASASLLWKNVRTNNLSAVLGGSWPAVIKFPLPADLSGEGILNAGTSTNSAALVLGLGARVYTVSGSPETVITAPVGSLCLRIDGGANTTLYVKESGTAATGWIAK